MDIASLVVSIVGLVVSTIGVFLTIRLAGRTKKIEENLEKKYVSRLSLDEYKRNKDGYLDELNKIIMLSEGCDFDVRNCKTKLNIILSEISALIIDEESEPFVTIKEDISKVNSYISQDMITKESRNSNVINLLIHMVAFINKPDIH